MRVIGIVLVASVIAASCNYASGDAPRSDHDTLTGIASVVDGDTIEIHGERIRLSGFDSPERGSKCGSVNVYQKAAFALSDFVGQRSVICDISSKDQYGRSIGDCEVGGQSLAEFMVSEGWARDWPRYSHGAYADEERQARNAHRGVWGLDCPSDLWGNRNYN